MTSAEEYHCWVVSLLNSSFPGNQSELHCAKNTVLCWEKVSGCRHVFLISDFSGWFVCPADVITKKRSLGNVVCPCVFHRLPMLRRLPCVAVAWGVAVNTYHVHFCVTPKVSSPTKKGMCKLTKSQWSFLGCLDLCKFLWLLLVTLPFSYTPWFKGVHTVSSSFPVILVSKGTVCNTSEWALYKFWSQDLPMHTEGNAQTGGLISNLPISLLVCR